MRWLFIACSSAIAFVYYVGARQDIKYAEKLNTTMMSTMYALMGRNSEGQIIKTTIEDEETPYYLPPGQPKEEPYREVGYLQ